MRVLVARMDDTTESGFKTGSLKPTADVPVRYDFDGPFVAKATITVDGSLVFAEIHGDVAMGGRWPALGGRCSSAFQEIREDFEILELSLCSGPNADPAIPPINVTATA